MSRSELAEPDFLEFVRGETRFKLGGREASEETVRRIASALGDRDNYRLFRVRLREWCKENTPESWGIIVALAREVGKQEAA